MKLRQTLAYAILGLSLFVIVYGGWSAESQTPSSKDKRIPVVVNQLPLDKGIVPVEVKCDETQVIANRIERLSCILKNNSATPVTAGGLRVTITLEREGKESQDSGLLTFDCKWQSQLRDDSKSLIPPAGEYRLEDLPSDYNDAFVRAIEIHLDYVEFADNNTLGPNSGASRVIGEARAGAAKYREWLSRQLEKAGGTIESILPLLERYQSLPEELEGDGGNQQEGAKRYRSYIRRVYSTKGPEEVRKQLKTVRLSAK